MSLAITLLAGLVLGVVQEQDAAPREDWIAKDVAIAERVHTAFALEAEEASELRAALGIPGHREDRDQGFGARVLRTGLGGGYTTHWVTLVTFRSTPDGPERVASVRVDARSSRNASWRFVAGPLRAAWGTDAALLDRLDPGLRIEWSDQEVLGAMRRAREAALGSTPDAEPGEALAGEVALLLDPLEEHDVGEVCYYAGVSPRGSEAALALAAAGRADLLRVVLRGPNPEGRVYAARELLRLRDAGTPLTAADRRALEAVRALDVPISTCEGCFVADQRASAVLASAD